MMDDGCGAVDGKYMTYSVNGELLYFMGGGTFGIGRGWLVKILIGRIWKDGWREGVGWGGWHHFL